MSELAYFQRRLADAQQATELPASARFDLAMSDMDDDTAEQTYAMFGGPAYGNSGFGMSDVLNEFLSRDPKFVSVNDLQTYQQNLIQSGYADPSLPADGTWNTYWAAASRKQDRDSASLMRSGQHLGAITTTKFFEYMAKTVPQGVFEAVVGAAKGLAESVKTVADNPLEAVEEGGALGTGVVGAIGGAAVAGPVGAAVGFVGGAAFGLAADFFDWGGEDEEDPDGALQQLWDALSPYDEYKKDGAKNFFALLDTVMLAAGAVKGLKVGAEGVKAALGSTSLSPGSMTVTQIGTSAAGEVIPAAIGPTGATVAKAGFREAFRRVAPGQVGPGMVARMTTAALKRPVLGGAVIGSITDAAPELLHGDFGQAGMDAIRGGAIGAATFGLGSKTKVGKAAITKATDLLAGAPLKRIVESGAGKVTRAIYTGLAIPATTARITADLTPGDDAVAQGIKEAEKLTESPVWDVMDLTVGSIIYPSRMLPLRPKEVGDALRAMDNTHVLMPFIRAEAGRLKQSITPDFIQEVRNKLGAHPVTGEYDKVTEVTNVNRMYLDKEISSEAMRLARLEMPEANNSIVGKFKVAQREAEIRAELVSKMRSEADNVDLPFSPSASEMFERSLDDQFGMQTTVENWDGRGTSIDNLLEERRAQDLLDAVHFSDAPPDGYVRLWRGEQKNVPENIHDVGSRLYPKKSRGLWFAETEREARSWAELGGGSEVKFIDVTQDEYRLLKETAEDVGNPQELLLDESMRSRITTWTDPKKRFKIMPALRNDPDTGVEGFLTHQEVTGLRDGYQQKVESFITARKQVAKYRGNDLLEKTATDVAEDLDKHLQLMRRRGLIDTNDYISLDPKTATPDYKVDPKIVKRLDEVAATRPVENTAMSDQLKVAGLDRYIAVNTGEDMLITADIPKMLEFEGIGEVVRRPVREWFAAMARKPDDFSDLGPMRYWSIATQLGKASDELGLNLTPKQMADTLYDFVRNRTDPEWALKNLDEVVTTNKTGTVIRRTAEKGMGKTRRELLKVDPRDLTAEDIRKAFKLDELPNIENPDLAAATIKHAAHVGGAFGADMMHPLATARELGRALNLQGLPAFNDFTRTAHIPMSKLSESSPGYRFFKRAKAGSWGYVPEHIRRVHLAAQFTFSPGFDISRYLEAVTFGAGKGMIPPRLVISPGNYIRNATEGWRDPLTGNIVKGPEAYAAMHRFADAAIYGTPISTTLDDQFARVNLSGMAGFKPREVEAAQSFYLAQRKAVKGPLSRADMDEIRETVLQINRYGKGQSAWAKSAHFVFFPFLFQAKQLQLIQDVAFGAPTRSALIHEGFRRWNGINDDPGLKEDFTRVTEKYFPLLREVARWNNLSYGVGLGRFWMEGLTDSTMANGKVAVNKSTVGQVADAFTRFLLPGGIHGPVGGAAGTATDVVGRWAADATGMDLLRHAFVPVVIYEDGSRLSEMDELTKVIEGLAPMYRDIQRWFDDTEGAAKGQIAALTEGGSGSYQLTSYYDTKRMIDMLKDQTATDMGYASWESLKNSPTGAPLATLADKMNDALINEFPQGAALASRFTNMDSVKGQALLALAGKDERTDAEEAIVLIGTIEEDAKELAAQMGVTQATILQKATPLIRNLALQYAQDKQFANLWESIGFSSAFGPIRLVAA